MTEVLTADRLADLEGPTLADLAEIERELAEPSDFEYDNEFVREGKRQLATRKAREAAVARGKIVVDSKDDWRPHAVCRGEDTEIFYLPERARMGPKLRQEEAAKNICARCPVLDQCREWAVDHNERWGVWGGLTPEEREELREQRKRSA